MMGINAKTRNPALKYISFIHSNTFFYRLGEFFSKKSLQNADCIFTDSEAFAEFIRSSHASRSEIKVISFFTRASPGHPTNASGD
ncbi:hypothetical protein SAMN05216327_101284 [Dyadobacter sp. SG02]|nr:hypothetical protein SAMN05216327_101284 [Dyadobacter sp. SG02]